MNENDSAVAKYARPPEATEDEPPVETRGCFGVRRSANGLSVMLDLRLQSGDRQALPYSHLIDLVLEGGATITATFTTAVAKIRGRQLAGLYDRLVEQRVAWIQEADRIDAFAAEVPSDGVVVEQIQIETEASDRPVTASG